MSATVQIANHAEEHMYAESTTALSYLDILITIEHGKYSTTLYDKRDSFQFDIVNFPNMSSNIPSKPTYGIYISQLVRIGRICSSYNQFFLSTL